MTAYVLSHSRLAVRIPDRARGFLYVSVGAAVAAAAATAAASMQHARWTDFAIVLAAGAFAQLFATHTSGNQVFHTGLAFSIAAALVLPPQLVVLVCVLQHVPEWVRQRYPWYVQTFNATNVVLSGLAAWSARAALGRAGFHLGGTTGSALVVVVAAGVAYLAVNHALLARMLWLARGYDSTSTGLFSLDGLLADGAVASVGIGIAFGLLHAPALMLVAVLPLVLIQRALAVPTLRAQAFSDHKTGLLNSRGIDQRAREEFARARRLGGALSVLICDIDNLRAINTRFGHLQGDAALAAVADSFRAELRPYDLCARIGGDEFLVILPGTDQSDALAVADRIQCSLEARPLETRHGTFAVNLSIGAATLQEDEKRIGDLIERADGAMYVAKSAGRTSFLAVG